MGKRTKKKVQSSISGRTAGASRHSSPKVSALTALLSEGGCVVDSSSDAGYGGGCTHGPNLEKLRSQLAKSNGIHCSGCAAKPRSGVSCGKDRRGRAKIVRKKPASSVGGVDDKGASHKLWICLSCGHVGCGLGNQKLTTIAGGELNRQDAKQGLVGKGHAWQHWLQLKHPVVMICGEDFSCWCFVCEQAHEMKHMGDFPSETASRSSGEGENDASASPSRALLLHESEILVRGKLTQVFVHTGDESGELTKGLENDDGLQSIVVNDGREESARPHSRNVMKGLMNLGNTCFFNSVMQNLLSVEVLHQHFDSQSAPEGVLTASLRNFFRDASARSSAEIDGALETGIKKGTRTRASWSSIDGTYNPKGLFGAICLKAPRFKGSQQQDSHELFKTLLDILHEEETTLGASSKPGAGEEALRALSKSEETITLAQTGDREGASPEDADVRTEEKAIELRKNPIQTETFVERVFGGQLSSTVTCCECGHSSVKYESFLDISLPIPSTKLPKKGSAPEMQSSGVQTRSQRVQALKNSRASGKTDPDLDIFRSVPAGLGTPLLLLPPPPSKEDKYDCAVTELASQDVWLDYMGPVTGPSETDWLDFVDVNSGIPSASSVEAGSRPTPGSSPRSDPETRPISIATLDSDLGASFTSNSNTAMQDLGGSVELQLGCNVIARGDASQSSSQSEQKPNLSTSVPYSIANGKSLDHIEDTQRCERFSLLQGAPYVTCEDKKVDKGLRPVFGQGGEVRALMRGGSRTAGFDSTRESELDTFAAAEQPTDTGTALEQLGNWNGDAQLQSDIIDGPNGPVILLGGPDYGTGVTGSNSELDGDFDGFGALFEEEENVEGQVFGPSLPLNSDELGLDDSAYEDVIFHDVLDLSKINIEGKTDWLVSHEDKEGEGDGGGLVSVDSCLQTFTKSELLSGENAWECDSCAKRYRDMFSAATGSASPSTDEDEPSSEQGLGESRGVTLADREPNQSRNDAGNFTEVELANDSRGCPSPDISILDVSHKAGDAHSNGDVPIEMVSSTTQNMSVDCGQSHNQPMLAFSLPSKSGAGETPLNVEEGYDQGQQQRSDIESTVGNTPVRSVLDPLDLNKLEIRAEPSGKGDLGDELISSSVMQAKDSAGRLDRKAVIEELNTASKIMALESTARNVAGFRSSGKDAKPKRVKHHKVAGERETVIKRDAMKRFLISKAPLVLTIQLKRFAQDMRGRLSKLGGYVAFQEFLDLHPFLDQRSVNFDFKYRLVGTVVHIGTLKSGHYVAFVRGPPASGPSASKLNEGHPSSGSSSWYHISDDHVRPTNLEEVLHSEAYLVFYERVDSGDRFQ